ncbi:zinc ribbon domain-containing protein, partial [Pyxidicoccus sp. 3LG]
TAPLSAATLFEPPPGFCPKCVAPRREGAESCGQCGLVYVNFIADEHRPSEALAGGWRALAERWEDWEAHDRLMTLALGRGELAMLGRLYRLRLAWAPDDPVAKRGLEEVVRRATLVVPSTPESSEQSLAQKRLKTVGVAVLFLVVLVLAVFILQNLRELMAGP